MAADSIAETARKASAGTWRKPRMKVYDYNQELGGNYYQPMIEYINKKTIQGPFFERKPVVLPEKGEIVSNKYSNMRYDDRSPVTVDVDNFLVNAYAKQIRELNSSTATARYLVLHNSKDDTFLSQNDLTGGFAMASGNFKHYTNQLAYLRQHELQREAKVAADAEQRRLARLAALNPPDPDEMNEQQKELILDTRTRYYWLYKTRNMRDLERWLE